MYIHTYYSIFVRKCAFNLFLKEATDELASSHAKILI